MCDGVAPLLCLCAMCDGIAPLCWVPCLLSLTDDHLKEMAASMSGDGISAIFSTFGIVDLALAYSYLHGNIIS